MESCTICRCESEDGFVRVTNNGNGLLVYFSLIMRVGNHDIVSESASIEVGQSLQIPIPHYVRTTRLNIYVSTNGVSWRNVFERDFNIQGEYCFSIQGEFDNPNIQRIPCNNFVNIKSDFKIVSENLRNNINCCEKNLFTNCNCYGGNLLANVSNSNKVRSEDGFVRITNDSTGYFTRFSLKMNIGDRDVTIESGDFSIDETRQLTIYNNALSTFLSIEIADIQVNWRLAFTVDIGIPGDYCFVVRGTYEAPTLTRTPCNR